MPASLHAFVASWINSGIDAPSGAANGCSWDSQSSPAQTLSLSAVRKSDSVVEVIEFGFMWPNV